MLNERTNQRRRHAAHRGTATRQSRKERYKHRRSSFPARDQFADPELKSANANTLRGGELQRLSPNYMSTIIAILASIRSKKIRRVPENMGVNDSISGNQGPIGTFH